MDGAFESLGAVTKYADEVTGITYANKLDIDSDFKGFNLDDSKIFFKNTDDIKPLENSKPDVVDDIIDKADDVVESGTNLGKMDLDDFPQNVKDSFKKYDDAGWQGNVSGQTQGTNAGRTWGNRKGQLPTVDADGNSLTYREFDVNNYNGVSRDGEKFIVGSDGSVWYTDSHYGQSESLNGIDDFVHIK